MRFRFQDWPIRRKLIGVIMLCCAVSLLGGSAALIGLEYWRFRSELLPHLSFCSDLLGSQAVPALQSGDSVAASAVLQSLRASPQVVEAYFYLPSGRVLAQYTGATRTEAVAPPLPASLPSTRFQGASLQVFRPVLQGDAPLGVVYMRADLRPGQRELLHYALIVVGVGILPLGLGWFLAQRLERLVSQPIRRLAKLVQDVGRHHDFSHRLPEGSGDELGGLTAEFNRMLDLIESHEDQVREQKQLLESILESMGDGVVVGNAEGRLILFSKAAREMVGLGIVNEPPSAWPEVYGLYRPDMKTPFPFEELPMLRAMRGESTDRVEVYVKNSLTRHEALLSVTGRPLRDAAGKIRGGVLVMRDITEAKRIQEQLRHTTERLAGMFQSAKDGIVFASLSGSYLDVNDAFAQMVGYSREELLSGMGYQDLTDDPFHAADREHAVKVAAGQAVEFEKEYRRKDGSRLPVSLTVFPINGENGDAMAMAGFVRDLSERHAAERALREHELRWKSLVNNSRDFILILDVADRISFINRVAYGYRLADLLGKPVYELLPPEARERSRLILREVRASGRPAEDEVMAPDLKGRDHWYVIRVVPVRRDHRVSELLLICTDVTERKQLEREVLEVADREQGRIGRDLHDGLSQVLVSAAFASNMLSERLDRQRSPDSRLAEEISEMLNEGIVQARTLARVLHPVSLDIQGLESALHELAKSITHLAGISCQVKSSSPVLLEDNAAAIHLFRIAQEAVNNAVRHAVAQSIVIELNQRKELLELQIRDDGVGMPVAPAHSGMGLRSMHYRAQMIGALLEVQPNRPRGTCIRCRYRPRRTVEEETAHG